MLQMRKINNRQLVEIISSARRQVIIATSARADPTPRCPDVDSAAGLASRGVRVLLHLGRSRGAIPQWATSWCAVTTGSGGIPRLAVIDGQAVLISANGYDYRDGATLVVKRPLAAMLERAIHADIRSMPTPSAPVNGRMTLEETERAVLTQLVRGMKDELAARDLGMATRTYRRVVAGLMRRLSASSRFQAGFRAAQLGLLSER